MSQLNALTIFDSDDWAPTAEENAFNWFLNFKHSYPNFKVTLFTILGRWKVPVLKSIKDAFPWIELAAHGWTHQNNEETLSWGKSDWYHILNKYEKTELFTKVWKSPNWQTTKLGYYCLKDMGWSVAIRKEQIPNLPLGMKYYCFETNLFAVHTHTWTMDAHQKEGRFLNWCERTEFDFVSNNLEEKTI